MEYHRKTLKNVKKLIRTSVYEKKLITFENIERKRQNWLFLLTHCSVLYVELNPDQSSVKITLGRINAKNLIA